MKMLTYEHGYIDLVGTTCITCEKLEPIQNELAFFKSKYKKLQEDHIALQDKIIKAYKEILKLKEIK
jgi:hypothetical protein